MTRDFGKSQKVFKKRGAFVVVLRSARGITAQRRSVVPYRCVYGRIGRNFARGAAFTEDHRIALRLASTWTIHQSTAVVYTAYHMTGATAVFSANPFERRFRDMHAIAQQIQARDTHYEDAGKAILAANLGIAPTAR